MSRLPLSFQLLPLSSILVVVLTLVIPTTQALPQPQLPIFFISSHTQPGNGLIVSSPPTATIDASGSSTMLPPESRSGGGAFGEPLHTTILMAAGASGRPEETATAGTGIAVDPLEWLGVGRDRTISGTEGASSDDTHDGEL